MSSANDEVVKTATALSVVEVALGALIHAFHVPIGGHVLSLNQGLFLTRLVRTLKLDPAVRTAPFYVSSISAILKSLSPAGNKLGPMLSISMQGLLYELGILTLGPTTGGVCVGMALLSVWAFFQPIVTYYLFFGSRLFDAIFYFIEKLERAWSISPQFIGAVVLALVASKALVAVGVGWWAFRSSDEKLSAYQEKLQKLAQPYVRAHPVHAVFHLKTRLRAVLSDLLRWPFLASLFLTALFLLFNQSPWSETVWFLLRPVGIAFVFYYLSRSPAFWRLLEYLKRYPRAHKFVSLFERTLEKLKH